MAMYPNSWLYRARRTLQFDHGPWLFTCDREVSCDKQFIKGNLITSKLSFAKGYLSWVFNREKHFNILCKPICEEQDDRKVSLQIGFWKKNKKSGPVEIIPTQRLEIVYPWNFVRGTSWQKIFDICIFVCVCIYVVVLICYAEAEL